MRTEVVCFHSKQDQIRCCTGPGLLAAVLSSWSPERENYHPAVMWGALLRAVQDRSCPWLFSSTSSLAVPECLQCKTTVTCSFQTEHYLGGRKMPIKRMLQKLSEKECTENTQMSNCLLLLPVYSNLQNTVNQCPVSFSLPLRWMSKIVSF